MRSSKAVGLKFGDLVVFLCIIGQLARAEIQNPENRYSYRPSWFLISALGNRSWINFKRTRIGRAWSVVTLLDRDRHWRPPPWASICETVHSLLIECADRSIYSDITADVVAYLASHLSCNGSVTPPFASLNALCSGFRRER